MILVIIGSFFMLNLVLGVLSGEFAKERERMENRRNFSKMREKQQMDREVDGYMAWIEKGEEVKIAEEEETLANNGYKVNFRFTETGPVDGNMFMSGWKQKWTRRERKMRILARKIVKSPQFYWIILFLVFANTLLTATTHHGMPEWWKEILEVTEVVFLAFFSLELLIKLYGLGWHTYFRSSFNTFDCVVVLGSLFEIIYGYYKPDASFGFSVMRALRLLRIFKMTSYWQSLSNLVISLMSSLKSIMSLIFLLFIFLFVFALFGMQVFGGSFNFDGETPSSNFDTFGPAFLTVFQILTGEDWNVVMYDGIRATGGIHGGGIIWSLYFILLVLLGNYTLLNVFLAIAVDNLANAQELTNSAEEEEEEKQIETTKRRASEVQNISPLKANDVVKDMNKLIDHKNARDSTVWENRAQEIRKIQNSETESLKRYLEARANKNSSNNNQPILQAVPEEPEIVPLNPYNSLFIFGPDNPIRVACHFIVNLKHFDNCILVLILISSITLAAEDPIGSPRNEILKYFDFVFTAAFTFELLFKVIDLGLFMHDGAYFRDPGNLLDFIVVCGALVGFALTAQGGLDLGVIKSLRVARVLRPLKSINSLPKLKAVFVCMIKSFQKVVVILMVYGLFMFIFSVIAVQLFNGKFYYCNDDSIKFKKDCVGSFVGEKNEEIDRVWERHAFHYDNVPYAFLTLFVISTGEGWPDVLWNSIAATRVDEAPQRNYNIGVSAFYIVFFIVFPFFFVNIFVAMVILTFQEEGENQADESCLEKNEMNCIEYAISAKPSYMYIPKDANGFNFRFWKCATNPAFDKTILVLILLNTVTLMMSDYRLNATNEKYALSLSILNIIFTSLFTIEFGIKIVGFGVKNYFRDTWNILDFVTVVGSIADIILSFIQAGNLDEKGINLAFLRLFRVARLIKLLRQSEDIRILIFTFVQSLKALPYVLLLIFMLFFIYAIIGMQMFGTIALDPDTFINHNNNFRSFPAALKLLFRQVTLEF